jgi:hypothetical protein
MRAMFARPFLLALLALACSAPAAGASTLGDLFVPDYDAADGVTVRVGSDRISYMHFGPKAAKLWSTIGGRRATVACGRVTPEDLGDGLSTTSSGSSRVTLPKRRTRVFLLDSSGDAELCLIATNRRKNEGAGCIPLSAPDDNTCIRVLVALTDSGRAFVDAKKRAIELVTVPAYQSLENGDDSGRLKAFLEPYVIALPDPDAAPPAGKVGYWTQGEDAVYSSLLADGKRAFVSMRGGVYSTNVEDLMGPNEDAFTIF